VEVLLRARSAGIRVEEAATLHEKLTGRIPVETIYPSTLIYADGFIKHSVVRSVITRFASTVVALSGLVLSAPLMLLTALAIRLESPGPIFYSQERVGKDGKSFDILKFRSMRTDAEQNVSPQWASRNDPRITRVGSIMRKLRIDELPQFINILKGEMNFVGPRPNVRILCNCWRGKSLTTTFAILLLPVLPAGRRSHTLMAQPSKTRRTSSNTIYSM